MGKIKRNIVWLRKVAVGSREAEANSDADLMFGGVDEVKRQFIEKYNELNAAAKAFFEYLENIKINADRYKNLPFGERKEFKRKLKNSCQETLNKLYDMKRIVNSM